MTRFDFHCRTRIVFGAGSVDRVGELARGVSSGRVLLVSDPGLLRAGHVERVAAALQSAGLTVAIFADAHENPTTDDVAAAVAVAHDVKPDMLVALGGGSTIDTAKAANMLATNGGMMHDYIGDAHGKLAKPLLPLVAIPTTAGTGSEVQRFALITDAATHRKMACGDANATPAIAIIDPQLTLTCPREVTVHAGVDALVHAIETAVTRTRNDVSLLFSHAAAERIIGALPRVCTDPTDAAARSDMLLGATLAGLAIENSMLGAAHACANPLTARFGIVHGHAVGLMLPHVMRFNAAEPCVRAAYEALAHHCDAASLIDGIESILQRTGMPLHLSTLGVTPGDIPALAVAAAEQWTAEHNPRRVTVEDCAALYTAAL